MFEIIQVPMKALMLQLQLVENSVPRLLEYN